MESELPDPGPRAELLDSEDDFLEHADPQAEGRQGRGHPNRRAFPLLRSGPKIRAGDWARIADLTADLISETRGRERFRASPPAKPALSSTIMARYRVISLGISRRTQKNARAMSLRDMREIERRSFPEMQMLLQISAHFPPRQLRSRPNAKGPDYEELAIPECLRTFTAYLIGIGGSPKPTQEMANYSFF